jgi:hypothetical protein
MCFVPTGLRAPELPRHRELRSVAPPDSRGRLQPHHTKTGRAGDPGGCPHAILPIPTLRKPAFDFASGQAHPSLHKFTTFLAWNVGDEARLDPTKTQAGQGFWGGSRVVLLLWSSGRDDRGTSIMKSVRNSQRLVTIWSSPSFVVSGPMTRGKISPNMLSCSQSSL